MQGKVHELQKSGFPFFMDGEQLKRLDSLLIAVALIVRSEFLELVNQQGV